MLLHNNWIEWFSNHPSNKDGNRNTVAFSGILGSRVSKEKKLRSLIKEMDKVILAANGNNKIMILYSPKNFGGTRSRPDNKVVCVLDLGVQAMCIHQFANSTCRLQDCGPSSDRAFRLQKQPKKCQHCSPRQK